MVNRCILLVLMTLVMQMAANAQRGVLLGTVWDSAHNYVLPSASVVVFNADSVMQQFTLANAMGEFRLATLPVDQRLYVIVSYTGYKTIKKYFIIRSPDTVFNFQRMNLHRSDKDQLDEVIVKAIIPVRMNGDTLEFNADAFTLEKNAVVEDLLRKLPGVTLWGDGAITVNGRKVSSVTVDGKPFFGGDAKIATQNLDKTVVDKVQVYKLDNPANPVDSLLNVNIKLKADKKTGHFGKVAAGTGTKSTYEGDLSINHYSPKIQAGVAGNINNVNKNAGDIGTLLRNSTFKGSGTQTDYLTNFSLPGENRTRALGYTLQYDFLPLADYSRTNLLQSDYFFTSDRNETDQHTLAQIAYSPDSLFTRQNNNTRFNIEEHHKFRTDYKKRERQLEYFTNADFNYHRSRFRNNDTGAVTNSQQELVSNNSSAREGAVARKTLLFNIGMDHRPEMPLTRYKGIRLSYTLAYDNDESNRNERTAFNSFVNATESRLFNRRYDHSSTRVGNTVDLNLPNLGTLLFGPLFGVRSEVLLGLSARGLYQRESVNDLVQDFDFANSHFKTNSFLTNRRAYDIMEATPSIDLSKRLIKSSANRYNKNAFFQLKLPLYARHDKSNSDQLFQTFSRNYLYFLPNADISYTNNRFGTWEQNFSLRFNSTPGYPTLQQLAPLTDSANIYYMVFGNHRLKAFITQELSAGYRFISGKRSKDLNAGLTLTGGRVHNNIIDSNNYDAAGRNQVYFVNTPLSTTYLRINGNVNTAVKIRSHQIQVQLHSTNRIARTPNYINNLPNRSNIFNSNNSLSLYYDFSSLLSFRLAQSVGYQRVRQSTSQHTRLSSVTAISQASVTVNMHKDVHVYSNLFYTYNKYGTSPAVKFNIWNMAVAYRLLEGKNAEVKLSALDILRQNKSIVNYINNTGLTTVTSNILQQYFMVTLSFYPRKFGKHRTSNEQDSED